MFALCLVAEGFMAPATLPAMRVARPVAQPPQMVLGGAGRSIFRAVRSSVVRGPSFGRKGPGFAGPGGFNGCGNDGGDTGGAEPAPEPEPEPESNPLVSAWKSYEKLLDEKPLIMKMLTSFTGFLLGDILAQVFITKGDFDWFRLFRLASFGFLVHGSTSHYFYGFLDGKIPGTSAPIVFTKVFIDQVLWNPIFGVMFFSYVALLEWKGSQYVVDKVKNELLTQVTGSWKVWPLAHTINFRFIPNSQRVLYINSIQIGYNCFLSLISNR